LLVVCTLLKRRRSGLLTGRLGARRLRGSATLFKSVHTTRQ
jgi:hypothetical protein